MKTTNVLHHGGLRSKFQVCRHDGARAFSQEEVAATVAKVSPGRPEPQTIISVAQLLSQSSGLSFHDIVGQVLWRHHGSRALRPHLGVVEDISWVTDATVAIDGDVFQEFFFLPVQIATFS